LIFLAFNKIGRRPKAKSKAQLLPVEVEGLWQLDAPSVAHAQLKTQNKNKSSTAVKS